jgi:formylglycine-generating enzyme required for sulfatase activity
LGLFDPSDWPQRDRELAVGAVAELFKTDPDPGLHSAAEWLLRRWGRADVVAQAEAQLTTSAAAAWRPEGGWYVNSRGQTMVVLGEAEYLMGAPEFEPLRSGDETQHRRLIGRRFALASKEVTRAEFQAFCREHGVSLLDDRQWSTTDDSPAVLVTWQGAVSYCNWLSRREGIPEQQWCYQEDPTAAGALRAKEGWLDLTGYRLPTEAEWEYACRAGTATRYYWGLAEGLVDHYAWHHGDAQERTWPGGRLLPNDFGLFDMLGNVQEWCHDMYMPYPPADRHGVVRDLPRAYFSFGQDLRVMRGGSFYDPGQFLRAADRDRAPAMDSGPGVGFRPARTIVVGGS